ncbi:MAG TPA: class I SAM-dependent methyltransferase [Candidatus Bathyarchaeia archaeon]|nr:class I SAM-dependent methyltransferase [Candidatus Bathyarchaeia archaeon]
MSNVAYWDSHYRDGDFEHWEFNYPSPELVAIVAAGILKKNSRILDAGCGGGSDAIFLARCGFRVIGVDISSVALEIAARRAKEAHVEVDWCLGSVLDMPVDKETIDLIVDRGLFHSIEDEDRSKYSSEVCRALKLHGLAIIRGASAESAAEDRFNPVTEEAIEKYFSSTFESSPVFPFPLFSVAGVMDGRLVVLRKVKRECCSKSGEKW